MRPSRSSVSARAAALAHCRAIRSDRVRMPRTHKNASSTPSTEPVYLRQLRSAPACPAVAHATTPPVTSPWPPRYFVALWTTHAAPRLSGLIRYGVVDVESTMSATPVALLRLASD